jgi:prolyl oligopeptidase
MAGVTDEDPYRWLENVDGPQALEWVRQRSARTVAGLGGAPGFVALRDGIRQVLDAQDRIPFTSWRGEYLYNLWKDREHPRGLWRRTTLEEYRGREPRWQVLLDVDRLAEQEGENWVWQGATVLRPGYERCLISLSRGGADASVVREFDLASLAFVADGFTLPEAKSDVAWIDVDRIFVGTDFGAGSLTSSGYPRIVKLWRRGTPLSEATLVFEGGPDDVAVSAEHDPTPGFERDLVSRWRDFFHGERYLRVAVPAHGATGGASATGGGSATDGGSVTGGGSDGGDGAGHGDGGARLVRIPVPDDAVVDVHREWLLIRPRTPWERGGTRYPAGCLLATRLDEFVAGGGELAVLFEPEAHTTLSNHAWTRNHLIMTVLSDVRSRQLLATPGPDGWTLRPLVATPGGDGAADGVPDGAADGAAEPAAARAGGYAAAGTAADTEGDAGGHVEGHTDVADTNPDHTDDFLLSTSGYTRPATLRHGTVDGGELEILKEEPAFFDAGGMSVRQFFAVSADGTRVPYFVVGSSGAGPALLTGYGGFELSNTPRYSGIIGRGWLERGGRYVVANIRGGGEYGPSWHHAAMRERRPRAYEDFAAVATDLVERGITTRDRLGIEGASNGGLLMGVMLTRYPHLFGAIVSQVPLLDLRRYHELLAGASWMAEYGDPDDPADWEYLSDFSPYHNVRRGEAYPPVLFVTSTRDDRVHPGHARKMVARMDEYGHDVGYYENIEGGHGAAADNAQLAFKWALVLEFLWQRLAGGGEAAAGRG